MNGWQKFFLLTAAAISATACSRGDYGDDVSRLERHLRDRQVGMSPDYFIAKNGNDRFALLFGMSDDFASCDELAKYLSAKYPSDRYACVPAQSK